MPIPPQQLLLLLLRLLLLHRLEAKLDGRGGSTTNCWLLLLQLNGIGGGGSCAGGEGLLDRTGLESLRDTLRKRNSLRSSSLRNRKSGLRSSRRGGLTRGWPDLEGIGIELGWEGVRDGAGAGGRHGGTVALLGKRLENKKCVSWRGGGRGARGCVVGCSDF